MSFFLAIDAGGTKTTCLLADDSNILARASTGSIKLQRVSETEATTRLTAMLDELSSAAAVPLTQITRTCIGLAGLSIPAVRAWATRVLSTHVAGELLLLGDEEIALDAAFPNASGILLIAGTGSNAIGRAADGTLHRAGGWGPILGDQGGGYWIGLEALRATLRALDQSAQLPPEAPNQTCHSERSEEPPNFVPTAVHAHLLLTEIQSHLNLSTLPELIELGNRRTSPTPDFAALAPVIARAAASGNPIASATLHRAAAELSNLVTAVAHKITSTQGIAHPSAVTSPKAGLSGISPTTAPLEVTFTGSILTSIPAVHTAFAASLAQSLPTAHLHPTPIDPLEGALHRARQFLPSS
jgi:glucosamine kinase